MVQGSSEAADKYKQASSCHNKDPSGGGVQGGHGGLSFGLKFWETVHLWRGMQGSDQAVFSGGGELLIQSRDIVEQWNEYIL